MTVEFNLVAIAYFPIQHRICQCWMIQAGEMGRHWKVAGNQR